MFSFVFLTEFFFGYFESTTIYFGSAFAFLAYNGVYCDYNIVLAVLAITFHCTRRDTASVVDYPPGLEKSTDTKGL